MYKLRLVVFGDTNARILVNPANAEELRKLPNVAENPDLSSVRGLPPHFWKYEGGKVLPMSEDERKAREHKLSKQGAETSLPALTVQKAKPRWPVFFIGLLTGLAILGAIHVLSSYL